MYLIIPLCLIATALAQYNDDCPGGYRNGQIQESDPYWYECRNGRLELSGCLSDTGRRIPAGYSYDTEDFEWRCDLRNGFVDIKQAACIFQGRRVRPGETYETPTFYYTCKQDGSWLRGEVQGCIFNGRRVAFYDNVQYDSNVYKCTPGVDGTGDLEAIGCVYNGVEYMIGEQFEDDQFFYSCVSRGDRCEERLLGCVHRNRRYSAFQTFHEDNTMYRCMFSQDMSYAEHKKTGCVKLDQYTNRPVEKKFDCHWEDGRAPFFYLATCRQNEAGDSEIRTLRCKYAGPEGGAEVMPNCYAQVGQIAVGCKRKNDGDLEIVTWPFTDESQAYYHGLSYWGDDPFTCSSY